MDMVTQLKSKVRVGEGTTKDSDHEGTRTTEIRDQVNNANNNAMHDSTINGIRDRMQEMQHDVLEHVNDRISDMVSEVLYTLKVAPAVKRNLPNHSDKYRDKRKSKDGILPDKEFVERNSLLTELFEINHFRTIYNVFMVILILMLVNTSIYDYMETGTTNFGLTLVKKGFQKFPTTMHIWGAMTVSTFLTYVAFNIWSQKRLDIAPKSLKLKLWDLGWLAILILYQIGFIIYPVKALLAEDLTPVCSTIILMEQIRQMMKTHAFVRSNASKYLSYKPHTENEKPKGPGFSQYLYFMFAPTLVYRDSYPRTKKIRWNVVIWHSIEVLMVILCVSFAIDKILKSFENFGKQPIDLKHLIMGVCSSMIPSILIFLCAFYCLLHSWQNGAAELLRFADRLFYKDWWNAKSFGEYYRTWNVVVHDWLYTYIYKDFYENILPGNKVVATCAVFSISALVHEYILAVAFRFFYPVMMVLFTGAGLPLTFTRGAGNVFIWLSLTIGTGLMLSFYTLEYMARLNCPPIYDNWIDLFLPRSWMCQRLEL